MPNAATGAYSKENFRLPRRGPKRQGCYAAFSPIFGRRPFEKADPIPPEISSDSWSERVFEFVARQLDMPSAWSTMRRYSFRMFPSQVFARACPIVFALLLAQTGCESGKSSQDAVAPPDARRAQIRSDAELAAERRERIDRGEIVPGDAPVVEAERKRLEAVRAVPAQTPRIEAPASAIQGDILLVNKQAVTVDEVLYALRDRIAAARQTKTKSGL